MTTVSPDSRDFTTIGSELFLTLERDAWHARIKQDVPALQGLLATLQQQVLPAALEPWRVYYQAYLWLLCCQLGHDTSDSARQALEVLREAHGSTVQSGEFYTLAASAYGFLAAAAKDPISKAKAGMSSDNSFKHALQAEPDNPRTHLLQGLSYMHKPVLVGGSKKKALAAFNKALQLYSRSHAAVARWPAWGQADAIYWLAIGHLHFNQFSQAQALADQLAEQCDATQWAAALQQKIDKKMQA